MVEHAFDSSVVVLLGCEGSQQPYELFNVNNPKHMHKLVLRMFLGLIVAGENEEVKNPP